MEEGELRYSLSLCGMEDFLRVVAAVVGNSLSVKPDPLFVIVPQIASRRDSWGRGGGNEITFQPGVSRLYSRMIFDLLIILKL